MMFSSQWCVFPGGAFFAVVLSLWWCFLRAVFVCSRCDLFRGVVSFAGVLSLQWCARRGGVFFAVVFSSCWCFFAVMYAVVFSSRWCFSAVVFLLCGVYFVIVFGCGVFIRCVVVFV